MKAYSGPNNYYSYSGKPGGIEFNIDVIDKNKPEIEIKNPLSLSVKLDVGFNTFIRKAVNGNPYYLEGLLTMSESNDIIKAAQKLVFKMQRKMSFGYFSTAKKLINKYKNKDEIDLKDVVEIFRLLSLSLYFAVSGKKIKKRNLRFEKIQETNLGWFYNFDKGFYFDIVYSKSLRENNPSTVYYQKRFGIISNKILKIQKKIVKINFSKEFQELFKQLI